MEDSLEGDSSKTTPPQVQNSIHSDESATTQQFPDIPADSPLASELGSNSSPAPTTPEPSSLSLLKAENPRGTLVILNGCQTQNAHTALIKQLSQGLIAKSWNTLLLDLPNPDTKDYVAKIEEGIKYANTQAGTAITLLGHGCDGQAVLNQAVKNNRSSVSAYITLSLDDKTTNQQTYQLNAPLLDIHGSIGATAQSNPTWLKSVEKSGGRRMELPMANTDFLEQEDNLIFLISKWLKTQ